jgi:hypothetical protein
MTSSRTSDRSSDVSRSDSVARDLLADGVHTLALEAVVGPHGEIQIVDRQREAGDVIGLGRRRPDLDALGRLVELTRQTEQLDQGLTRRRQGVPRTDRVLGLDVEDQLVEVGALLDTGASTL